MKKLLLLLAAILWSCEYLDAQHTIIYMISPPRSMSVSFLRMMQQRGDFQIFHEPSQWVYCNTHCHDLARDRYKLDSPETYQEVKNIIFQAAQEMPVFVKEMSFAVWELLLEDEELMKNENVHFVFLLRNPHHATISHYKIFPERNDLLSYWLGYQASYELFDKIKQNAVNKPVIIFSEDIYLETEKTIRSFCDYFNIPFKPESLSWENIEQTFTGDEWHELKYPEHALHWHGDAIKSTGFKASINYKVDVDGRPTFEEILDINGRIAHEKAYYFNKTYYDLLLKEKDYFLLKK